MIIYYYAFNLVMIRIPQLFRSCRIADGSQNAEIKGKPG